MSRPPRIRSSATAALLVFAVLALQATLSACAGDASRGGAGGSAGSAGPTPGQGPVVVWFDEFNEVLAGTSTRYGELQPRMLDVTGQVASVRCVGEAPMRVLPPDAVVGERCDGVRGVARLSCSDGRLLALEWILDPECRSGYGQGEDNEGHVVRMAFGGSQERARTAVREALAQQALKPMLPEPGRKSGGVSTGTAFFVTSKGHLITNHHVIEGRTRVGVLVNDGDLVQARVLATDEENDLALLQTDVIRRPLPLRSSHSLTRGTEVLVLGYPLIAIQGTDQKATFGRINALKGMQGDDRFTQIDAPIQPGNSGGPLITHSGEVVGVVTAMLNPVATLEALGVMPQNVNYALKSDFAYGLVRKTLGDGYRPSSGLGTGDWTQLIDLVEDSVVLVVAQ